MLKRSKCSLIGIPDDRGVFNVGGRVGAARGPQSFRKLLARLKGRLLLNDVLTDCGDVLRFEHRQTADSIAQFHSQAGLSIVVGGGHDHGYSQLLGIKNPSKKLGCINIDAHFDVRKPEPLIGSGSPFYLAIENHVLDSDLFIEFGIQSHCNAPELWEYIKLKKIKMIEMKDLRHKNSADLFKVQLTELEKKCDEIVISLDLDAVENIPGVSAPQSEGISATDMIEICEIAGRSKKVVSLGIFELNPEHDVAEQTARLAATGAYHFLESKFE